MKITITYTNGYVNEITTSPEKYGQELDYWRHQQDVNPNIEDIR